MLMICFDFFREETTVYVSRNKHVDKTETLNHLKDLTKRMDEDKALVWSVVDKKDKRVIGTVNLYLKQDRAASIGAVIRRERWGKGIATEALREVISFGFDQMELIRIEGKCESKRIVTFPRGFREPSFLWGFSIRQGAGREL